MIFRKQRLQLIPKISQEIQVFNGMAQFYRCFIKKIASIMAPITKLFKKIEVFKWIEKPLKKTSRTSTFKLLYSLVLTRNQNFIFILMHLNQQQEQYWPKTQQVKQINLLCIHQDCSILLKETILPQKEWLQLWSMPYASLGITC